MNFNLDELRAFIKTCPGSPPIKKLRLVLFDRYRYEQDYEKIYKMVTDLGGVIQ